MPDPNERVELAYQILELRHKIRQVLWDPDQVAKLQAELAQLEQKLREIDE